MVDNTPKWEDTKAVDQANVPKWEDTMEHTKYSPLESGALGAIQGGTLGFADELEGGLRAAVNKPFSDEDISNLYQKYRDIARNRNEQARSDNPWSYGTGEVAGGVGTMFVPGLNIAKGAKFLPTAAKMAGIGAAAGYGSSNASDAQKQLTDAEIGAGLGVAGAGVGQAVSKTAELFPNISKYFTAGERGKNYLGEKGKEFVGKGLNEAADLYEGATNTLRSKLGSAVESAKSSQEQIPAKDVVEGQLDKINNFLAKTTDQNDYPELLKIKSKLENLIYGKEVTTEVPVESEKLVPGKMSSYEKLQQEANKLTEQSKLSGENASYDVVETTGEGGEKYNSLVKKTKDVSNKAPEAVEPVFDENGNQVDQNLVHTGEPSVENNLKVKTVPYQAATPEQTVTEQQMEKQTSRVGGTETPTVEKLSILSDELRDLTNNLKQQYPRTFKDLKPGEDILDYVKQNAPNVKESSELYSKLKRIEDLVDSGAKIGPDTNLNRETSEITQRGKLLNYLENLDADSQRGRRGSDIFQSNIQGKEKGIVPNIDKLTGELALPPRPEIQEIANDPETQTALAKLQQFKEAAPEAAEDFQLAKDLRLKGVGLGAKVHAVGNLLPYAIGKGLNNIDQSVGAPVMMTAAKGIADPALYQNVSRYLPELLSNSPQRTQTKPVEQKLMSTNNETKAVDESKVTENPDNKSAMISRNLYNLSPVDLQQVSMKLVADPTMKVYSDALNKALQSNDQLAKDRVLFLISQNPVARKLLYPADERQESEAVNK